MAEDLDQFGLVLEESLRLLHEAGEPIDAILLRFPAWADQLRPRLLTASWLGSTRLLFDPHAF